jgi:hypothetical protein
VLGMVAEMERRFMRERQQAGIEAAKKRGVYRGRKPTVPADRVREMRAAGRKPGAIAKELGISRMHVHRLTKVSQRLPRGGRRRRLPPVLRRALRAPPFRRPGDAEARDHQAVTWLLFSSSAPEALAVAAGLGRFSAHGPHYSRRSPGSRTFRQRVLPVSIRDRAPGRRR